MLEVPEHCIKKFIELFKIYPSFIQVKFDISETILNKLTKKTKRIWINKECYNNECKNIEEFLEYDPNGIMIYIKDEINVVFLSLPDKIQNIELILSQIKRLKNK